MERARCLFIIFHTQFCGVAMVGLCDTGMQGFHPYYSSFGFGGEYYFILQ